ncbi:SbcC/MukB-like Walker B domain-containing protein [Streptomyces sp. ISL-43]|uniref:SbcC/MukB-like Walker B domain-containing protein n=1 Tax=Streptomyces sp. ISL-43 TaxID=2819183 RepID=UPI0027E45B01|nr:SbcC/MukB-like Walker B domain-containing protein [Streptomyces sp. ISL-43]
MPLFAAASSHCASASSPDAPRLVTLDEAFAGVDDDSHAKCLDLLHAFDLDVVMTSEREWPWHASTSLVHLPLDESFRIRSVVVGGQ